MGPSPASQSWARRSGSTSRASADHDGDDLVGANDPERRPSEVNELAREATAAALERVQLGLGVLHADLQLFAVAEPELEVRHASDLRRGLRSSCGPRKAEPPPHRGSVLLLAFRESRAAWQLDLVAHTLSESSRFSPPPKGGSF